MFSEVKKLMWLLCCFGDVYDQANPAWCGLYTGRALGIL